MPRLSWAARTYVGAVVAVGGLLICLGPFNDIAWRTLSVLVLLFLICDSTPALISPRHTWSASSSSILAAIVLVGPVGAAIVGSMAAFAFRRGVFMVQRAFNSGMYAMTAYAAGRVYLALGGPPGVPVSASFPAIIGPFAAAAVTHAVVNDILVNGVLRLTRPSGSAPRTGLGQRIASLIVPDLGYAMFGLLIAALWRVVGPFSAVLLLVPLFVARWAVAQYVAQQKAHEATMAALCQAVETKDFYTRGHSERVSRASVVIAKELGFRSRRLEAIRHAGMLHDIGKLGVPTLLLQKPGALTAEEYAAIQLHPMRGLEIVREIGFLDEALAGILHHHERIDGKGYPLGLAGDQIPEFARVIGVADAFDCMTSTRSYRGAKPVDEAIAELRKCSGVQFDPDVVEAFIAALQREPWQAPEPVAPPQGQPAPATVKDHDDPTAPLQVLRTGDARSGN